MDENSQVDAVEETFLSVAKKAVKPRSTRGNRAEQVRKWRAAKPKNRAWYNAYMRRYMAEKRRAAKAAAMGTDLT